MLIPRLVLRLISNSSIQPHSIFYRLIFSYHQLLDLKLINWKRVSFGPLHKGNCKVFVRSIFRQFGPLKTIPILTMMVKTTEVTTKCLATMVRTCLLRLVQKFTKSSCRNIPHIETSRKVYFPYSIEKLRTRIKCPSGHGWITLSISWIDLYPADNAVYFVNTHPPDYDQSYE